jgi:FixJ family two-component response regulator
MDDSEKEHIKIVVVEDSNLSRKTIIETLEAEGFEVVGEAQNAEQAMSLIQTSGCNCIILDIVMPEISGIELAHALSELKNKISIIMMSSLKQEDIIIESIAAGAIDFIEKPFDKKQLIQSVKKAEEDLELRA